MCVDELVWLKLFKVVQMPVDVVDLFQGYNIWKINWYNIQFFFFVDDFKLILREIEI